MGKFIVIEKQEWDVLMQYIKEHMKTIVQMVNITELSTDESIEDRAEKAIYNEINKGNYELSDSKTEAYFNDGYLKGATEQSLIEQMKAKELINLIGYHISDSGFYMAKYVNGGVVWLNTEAKEGEKYEYTTEELFNQFTNQKQ